MTMQVIKIDHALTTFSSGSNGIASCVTKQIASVVANSAAKTQSRSPTSRSRNQRGKR